MSLVLSVSPETIVLVCFCLFLVYLFIKLLIPSENQKIIQTLSENLKILSPSTNFVLSENKISDYTFTLEKKFIFICLKNKNINTLMYVAIHELAHIESKDYGHGPEFISNFQRLLSKAISLNLYKYTNYQTNPEKYCNMVLNSMVL